MSEPLQSQRIGDPADSTKLCQSQLSDSEYIDNENDYHYQD